MLDDVESTLDSGKNFTMYKQRLKQVDAPCVPFLGAFIVLLFARFRMLTGAV